MGVRQEARTAVSMRLLLLSTVTSILWGGARITAALKPSVDRESSEDCRSCLDCSHDNGCVRCPERLFLFLQRDGMSHHGVCLQACPPGHYGQRGKQANTCMRCRSVDCEQCFSRDFCTRCRPGLQLYKGRCLSGCPPLTFHHHGDCLEDCVSVPWGVWGEWTPCLRGGAPCGFRWGRQTRTRQPELTPRQPDEKSRPKCPAHRERRSCRMRKRCETEDLSEDLRGIETPAARGRSYFQSRTIILSRLIQAGVDWTRAGRKPGLGLKRERKRLLLQSSGASLRPEMETETQPETQTKREPWTEGPTQMIG